MTVKIHLVSLVVGCIVAGAVNSLATKYQDNQCVHNCSDPDSTKHEYFEQPVIQVLQMFLGELGCFLVYRIVYSRAFNNKFGGGGPESEYTSLEEVPNDEIDSSQKFQLALPAFCDLVATTLMNLGLICTPVSIYQMSRGSIVLFVAILSCLFLNRKITRLEWISLFLVTLGVVIVGLSGSNNSDPISETNSTGRRQTPGLIVLGILFIGLGELVQAVQFVVEEKIVTKHAVLPLKLVYYEGFWGTLLTILSMLVAYVAAKTAMSSDTFVSSPFNFHESFAQTFSSSQILSSSILEMFSIAVFNYCGISLTSELSATSRSTIDTSRTLLVWLCAIVFGWETFHFLQFFGYTIVVFGILCFNGVLKPEEWDFVPTILKSPISPPKTTNQI